jgi:hypothetical protein
MSKTRFKRPKNWRSKPLTPEAVEGFKSKDSRQQRRARNFAREWWNWLVHRHRDGSISSAPRDEHGIMPRRIRRAIARQRA